MNDIARKVWVSYHLETVQAEHPLRVLCLELSRAEESAEKFRLLAVEAQRRGEEERRENTRLRALLSEARSAILEDADVHDVRGRIDEALGGRNTAVAKLLQQAEPPQRESDEPHHAVATRALTPEERDTILAAFNRRPV